LKQQYSRDAAFKTKVLVEEPTKDGKMKGGAYDDAEK